MSIVTEWEIRTRAAMKRSASLKALDASVLQYATHGTGPRDANAVDVWTKLQAWKAKEPAEYAKINGAADELGLVVKAAYNKRAIPLAGVLATEVGAVGYRLYAPGNPFYEQDGDAMLPLNQRLPALSPAQIRRINEAVARVTKAVTAARDTMIKIAHKPTLVSPMNAAEKLFVDYFGTFDKARATAVLGNFNTLHEVVSGKGPIVFDHRNTDFGEDCYAACKRGHVKKDIKIWMGRDFFSQGTASSGNWGSAQASEEVFTRTTDATVGTLVHELSHGAFAAVDAPPVSKGGAWKLTPDAGTWASPDNDVQSSTPELDKRLAAKEPNAAIVNADNYGQFAVEAMRLVGA